MRPSCGRASSRLISPRRTSSRITSSRTKNVLEHDVAQENALEDATIKEGEALLNDNTLVAGTNAFDPRTPPMGSSELREKHPVARRSEAACREVIPQCIHNCIQYYKAKRLHCRSCSSATSHHNLAILEGTASRTSMSSRITVPRPVIQASYVTTTSCALVSPGEERYIATFGT